MTWPDASIAAAIGVGVGSAVWFTVLARLVAKVPPDHRALRVLPKMALVIFVGIAITGVARAL
jgi:hypothetical protein